MQTTILIIEDNALNLKLIAAVLARYGHHPLTAADAETGIEMARRQSPDLILMDIQLPGMDGITATQQLKGDPRTAGIPIVALSAHAMTDHEEKAAAAGCCGYITKPFSTRSLIDDLQPFLKTYSDQTRDGASNPD